MKWKIRKNGRGARSSCTGCSAKWYMSGGLTRGRKTLLDIPGERACKVCGRERQSYQNPIGRCVDGWKCCNHKAVDTESDETEEKSGANGGTDRRSVLGKKAD